MKTVFQRISQAVFHAECNHYGKFITTIDLTIEISESIHRELKKDREYYLGQGGRNVEPTTILGYPFTVNKDLNEFKITVNN